MGDFHCQSSPTCPVAINVQQSLVEVSPSTVMRLMTDSPYQSRYFVAMFFNVGIRLPQSAKTWSPYWDESSPPLWDTCHRVGVRHQFRDCRYALWGGISGHDVWGAIEPPSSVKLAALSTPRWFYPQQRFPNHPGGVRQYLLGCDTSFSANATHVVSARCLPSSPVAALALPVLTIK